ncbi:Fucose permease [Nocardia amikacinitolerans]|uniref:MFS transporter n=2 Tax=Nocardia amikacinitolerans TaxID=756689 RepID=UPI000833F741|nr:MFS transporter [Nocardia amikacinitolerans]MCP2316517.1 Fucose permease [Nocardia amikacinitolerans]
MTRTIAPALERARDIPDAVVRSRGLLTGYFAGLGVVMAVWGTRIPAIQESAGLDTAGLAAVLLAAAVGMVAGLQLGGRLAEPARLPQLLTCGALGLAVSLALLGVCRTPITLAAAALLFGAAHGVLDVAANGAAVRCQQAYGRPIMSGLHAAYSLGALGGAVLAAVTAHDSHTYVFGVTAGVAIVATVAGAPATRCIGFPAADLPLETAAPERLSELSRSRLWLLGLLAAACLLGEGAAADWSAVHLSGLQASPAISAAAYAGYSAAMAAGRLVGDRLIARFGAPKVVRTGAFLASIGLVAGLAVTEVPFALAGWAAFGLGLSVTIPSLFSAAGTGGPRAVATVAVAGYLGLLAGPALIGALATVTSLPIALMLPALLAAGVAVLSHRALENRW